MESFLKFFRVLFRFILVSLYLTIHVCRGLCIYLFVKDPFEKKRHFANLSFKTSQLFCRTFGIRVAVINPPPKEMKGLIVGNHLGFIDIIASSSIRPMLHVTSLEMQQTPILGVITDMTGCVYVERRSRLGIKNELEKIATLLKQGLNVCLYPEATSHNGEHVLPFKRTLLTAAAHAGVPILPYVFNFTSVNGQEFSLKNRDHVCWYGDISFISAMLKAISLKYVDVELKFLPPFFIASDMERSVVANTLHQMISQEFVPVKGL